MNRLGVMFAVAGHALLRRPDVLTSAGKVTPSTGLPVTGRGGMMIRRVSSVLAALLAASASLAFAAPAAPAQPIGTVIVIPGEGNDLTSIRLRTSRGCPPVANAYYARMFGQGFPRDGLIATANTSAGLAHTTGFDVYFAQTMRDFGDLNGGVAIGGRYDIVVYCIDKFPSRVLGEFTGSLEFTTPTTYRALGESLPSGPPPEPLKSYDDEVPLEDGLAPPGKAAVPDGNTRAAPTAIASNASYLPLVLIALIVAVLGVFAVVRGVRRRRSP